MENKEEKATIGLSLGSLLGESVLVEGAESDESRGEELVAEGNIIEASNSLIEGVEDMGVKSAVANESATADFLGFRSEEHVAISVEPVISIPLYIGENSWQDSSHISEDVSDVLPSAFEIDEVLSSEALKSSGNGIDIVENESETEMSTFSDSLDALLRDIAISESVSKDAFSENQSFDSAYDSTVTSMPEKYDFSDGIEIDGGTSYVSYEGGLNAEDAFCSDKDSKEDEVGATDDLSSADSESEGLIKHVDAGLAVIPESMSFQDAGRSGFRAVSSLRVNLDTDSDSDLYEEESEGVNEYDSTNADLLGFGSAYRHSDDIQAEGYGICADELDIVKEEIEKESLENGLFSYSRDYFPDFDFESFFESHQQSYEVNSRSAELTSDKIFAFKVLCKSAFEFIAKTREGAVSKTNEDYDQESLKRQKRALMGYPSEVGYFKSRIQEYLKETGNSAAWYPSWYPTLTDAVFQENYGLLGVAEWLYGWKPELINSSSAKIIGDNIFFMVGGRQVLQPQKISAEERAKLRRILLTGTKLRDGEGNFEVYTLDGTRISIYGDDYAKDGLDIFVFRKFLVKDYTFEKQSELGTIPMDAIDFMKAFAQVGFNQGHIGAVRTTKTTQMVTHQSYELPHLEGVMIETDPEIPLHKIMPKSPIIQMIADGKKLEGIMKGILRLDPDYIIMAEARDAVAFHTILEATDRGNRRCKFTAHFSRGRDFPYAMAKRISKVFGGSVYENTVLIYQNIHYIFEYIQLSDKSKKRLKGIYELRYDSETHDTAMYQICRYDFASDSWTWNYTIGEDKRDIGLEENPLAFNMFEEALRVLADKHPMKGKTVFRPINNMKDEE